jgi:hypothetical protein
VFIIILLFFMSHSAEELRNLGFEIANDPDRVNDLPIEDVLEIRKTINPIGGIVETKKTYVNMSILNWKDSYLRNLHTVALVGYLYRVLSEYEPTDQLAEEDARFENVKKSLSGDQLAAALKDHSERRKLIISTANGIIKKFLNRHFKYNPDLHVRSSHTTNKSDPERQDKDQLIAKNCEIAESSKMVEEKLRNKPEMTFKYMRNCLLNTYQYTNSVADDVKSMIKLLSNPTLSTEDKQGILLKKYQALRQISSDMQLLVDPLIKCDTLSALTIDPPADLYHHFDRYLTNNYTELRDVVKAVYNDKPDIELGVIIHGAFKSQDAARDYCIQHESEFRTDVYTVESGAVCLLGPFRENTSRVEFYNKHTEIMKQMMEQVEADHKLGKDIMEKRVSVQKRKNIAEAGPDAPGLSQYTKAINVVKDLGAKKVLSKEDMEKLEAAKKEATTIKEDYEVPEGAIQLDIFYPKTNEDGETVIEKRKMYTQAESPLHLTEGSQYNDTYQPKREEVDDPIVITQRK